MLFENALKIIGKSDFLSISDSILAIADVFSLVCIDNLMTAMDIDVHTDLFRQQSNFVKKLEKLAQQYDVAVLLIAHPKKISGDFDNDAVSGSSDITNAVSFVWNYQRSDSEADSELMVTKNRMTGKLLMKENAIKLYYNQKSKRISTSKYDDKEYSCFKKSNNDWFNEAINDLPM